ncbi:MAG: Nif3-like dinuclear metal center hexameric protein [Oscillibacter sp.]|nr:Nif3-like dinuclear metal center hexameric protein [Oscillibacter sp.]
MPTVREIERFLYGLAPRETAMEWDNVGLLVGDPEAEATRILVSLDITEDVVREAEERGCQVIVAHHPVMNCTWHRVQTIRTDDFRGRLLRLLVKENVAAVCMHTNLDRAAGGVNDCLAAALGLENVEELPSGDGVCRMGTLPAPMPLDEFAGTVLEALDCAGLRYADGGRQVYRVAVGGGACGEYAEAALRAGCDTFVTADVKYHDFLDARAMGLNMVDAGHYPTENPVCKALQRWLREAFPGVEVELSARHRDVIHYLCGKP